MSRKFDDSLNTRLNAFSIEAWVQVKDVHAEAIETVAARWALCERWGNFDAFDAAQTDGLVAAGYFGAVFDGRFIYFVPEMTEKCTTHAVILRFDTHGPFQSPGSYEAIDASQITPLETRGFYGGAFNGRFVYFIPRQFDRAKYHSRLLRFDTTAPFRNPKAWDAHDINREQSAQGCAFDGRYLYLCPGFRGDPTREDRRALQAIRFDTRGDFHAPTSYETADLPHVLGTDAGCFDGGAFDGRYIYFVPLAGPVVRFDTRAEFTDPKSWQTFSRERIGMDIAVGTVFDGGFMYFCAYAGSRIGRFDTRGDFTDPDSWLVFDADHIGGLRTRGFDGGFFDGRFVHFVPFVYGQKQTGYNFHTNFLRYDTRGDFDARDSWSAIDASRTCGLRTIGYNAGAFDGRYFYCAPWRGGPSGTKPLGVHGTILRYDTLDPGSVFSLRLSDYGHNGGLCAALRGPAFLLNTNRGIVNAVSCRSVQKPGAHHLVGTYDGREASLYLDGELLAHRDVPGQMITSDLPLTVGRSQNGADHLRGSVTTHLLHDRALNNVEVAARFRSGPMRAEASA